MPTSPSVLVKYHPAANALVITVTRPSEHRTVTVNLGQSEGPAAGSFGLTKDAKDNSVLSFTSTLGTVPVLTFRTEEDAFEARRAIERALLGQACPYKLIASHLYGGLRVILTTLAIILALLALSLIWKGYHSASAYQARALAPSSARAQASPPALATPGQVAPSPATDSASPAVQPPLSQASPVPPVSPPTSAPLSPADQVINGLNGH